MVANEILCLLESSDLAAEDWLTAIDAASVVAKRATYGVVDWATSAEQSSEVASQSRYRDGSVS